VASLITALGLVTALAACGGTSPATDQRTSTSVPPAAAQPATVPEAVPAPGSERLTPDQHPEQAHLTQVTVDTLADAISSYVQAESERHGGSFPVPDPDHGTSLGLSLTTVHRERLSQLGDGRYFACADFKGRDGNTYDVDLFMRAESTGLVPSEMIVHKVNGTPRFNWIERGGVWSRAPLVNP
jgi:hypothetical protein